MSASVILGKINTIVDSLSTTHFGPQEFVKDHWLSLLREIKAEIAVPTGNVRDVERAVLEQIERTKKDCVQFRVFSAGMKLFDRISPPQMTPDEKPVVAELRDEDRELWISLGAALLGEDDPRVQALKPKPKFLVGDFVIDRDGSTCIVTGNQALTGLAGCIQLIRIHFGGFGGYIDWSESSLRLATPDEIARARGEA